MDKYRKGFPKVILFSFTFLYLVLGIFIAPDFGVSMDEDVEYIRSQISLDLYTAEIVSLQDETFEFYDGEDIKYYGTASTVLFRFVERYFFPDRNHETSTVAHYGYFVFLQVAIISIFYLARHFLNDWTSLVVALIFGTQPIFFGHAFINPKDIPLLAVFLLTVVVGFDLVERWRSNDQEAPVAFELKEQPTKPQIRFALILAGLFLLLWSGPWIISLAKYLVEYSYNAKESNWLGNLFAALTTSGSIEGYLALAHLKILEIFRWLTLFALLVMGIIFYWSGKNHLFGKYVNISLLLASGVWGFAISTRVLALAAGGIVGIYGLAKLGRKVVLPLTFYTITASLFSVITWPFLWSYGLRGLVDSLVKFSDYPWTGPVLFEGIIYGPEDVPARYVPKMMALQFTEPLVILALAGFLLSLFLVYRQKIGRTKILLLYAWFGLPLLYTVIAQPTVYNNFRQYMFITPPLFILAGLFLQQISSWVKKPILFAVFCVLLLLPGVNSIVRLHPLQYIYYNSFTGGVHGAKDQYPLDYWNTNFVIAMEYLNENAPAGSKILVWKEDYHAEIYAEKYFSFSPHTVVPEEDYHTFDYAIMPTGRYEDIIPLKDFPVVFTVQVDGLDFLSVLKITDHREE